MQNPPRFAAATALAAIMICSGLALAQSGTNTAPEATAPETAAPEAIVPTPTTTPTAQTDTTPPAKAAPKTKKTATRKMTRQQEIEHSIATGTVPARYRSSIPKRYQQYIPFDKQ
jgi:hypothetical protein